MPFRRRDVASTTGGGGGLPLPLAAIRVHLSVPSISSSRQHANEGRCKRRPPSRECAIRAIVTDNTRENTIPASSAFLVCQVHVKARLRKSLPSPPPTVVAPSLLHLLIRFLFPYFPPRSSSCSSSTSLPPSLSLSLFLSLPLSCSPVLSFAWCRYKRDGYKRYRRSKGLQWI